MNNKYNLYYLRDNKFVHISKDSTLYMKYYCNIYYQKNKTKIQIKHKKYYETNHTRIRKRGREYIRWYRSPIGILARNYF
jgi:hypothetical protein